MRNQPGVEQEKAWPQLKTTLCLRKHLHRDNSSSNENSLRYYQNGETEVTHQAYGDAHATFSRNNYVELLELKLAMHN